MMLCNELEEDNDEEPNYGFQILQKKNVLKQINFLKNWIVNKVLMIESNGRQKNLGL